MTRPTRYPPELRERAVRLVREHRAEHPSKLARGPPLYAPRICFTSGLRDYISGNE